MKSILWAYLIAPPVAPALFAAFTFVFGMSVLALRPYDTGTPIAVVAVPVAALTVGVMVSYLAAGLIGLPILLWLERRQLLNGYTIHGTALITSSGFITVSFSLIYAVVHRPDHPQQLAVFGVWLFIWTAPFVLASATIFWWIVRRGIHGMSLRALLWTITILAILLAAAAPVLRVMF